MYSGVATLGCACNALCAVWRQKLHGYNDLWWVQSG